MATYVHSNHLQVPGLDNVLPSYALPDDQKIVLAYLNIYINGVSIAAASIVLLAVFSMRMYDKRLVDRVSLRLNIVISVTDLLFSIAMEILTIYDSRMASGCNVMAFLLYWLSNQYLFLSFAIAFNLQYLFLHKKLFNPAFEKWYFILALGLSLLSSAVPLAAGRFGYDEALWVCGFYPTNSALSQQWEYSTYLIPGIICILYCLAVVIMVIIKLQQESTEINKHQAVDQSTRADDAEFYVRQRTRRALNRIVCRVLLYPVIPLVTQAGFIVSEIHLFVTQEASYPLSLWAISCRALPGLCNFIAFMLDPAVSAALTYIRQDLLNKYGDSVIYSDTDSFFPVKPSPQSSGWQAYSLRWLVRTFFTVPRKPTKDTTIHSMHPDTSTISDYEAGRPFHTRWKVADTDVVEIPQKAEIKSEMDEIDLHAHVRSWRDGNVQVTENSEMKLLMLGL